MCPIIRMSISDTEALLQRLRKCSNEVRNEGINAYNAADSIKENFESVSMMLIPSLKTCANNYADSLDRTCNALQYAIDVYRNVDSELANKQDAVDTDLFSEISVISDERSNALKNNNHTPEMDNAVLSDSYAIVNNNGREFVSLRYDEANLQTQGKSMCTAYSWAFGMNMVHPDKSFDPYRYWVPYKKKDGEMSHHCSFSGSDKPAIGTSSQQYLLRTAYDELINNGKPSVIFAKHQNARNAITDHAVTIIGVNPNADPNNLQPSDFLVYDPSASANNANHIWTMDNVKYTDLGASNARLFKYK